MRQGREVHRGPSALRPTWATDMRLSTGPQAGWVRPVRGGQTADRALPCAGHGWRPTELSVP